MCGINRVIRRALAFASFVIGNILSKSRYPALQDLRDLMILGRDPFVRLTEDGLLGG